MKMKMPKYYFPQNVKIDGTRLTPIQIVMVRGKRFYECRCDCGNTTAVEPCALGSKVKSCGCLKAELTTKRCTTHGLSKTKEFIAARSAWRRCNDPSNEHYASYGGRGIKFEFEDAAAMAKWLIENMPRPSGRVFIDRINNDGPYSKTNLRWADAKTSSRNHRNTHYLTIGGVTKPEVEWAEIGGVHPRTLHDRIARGVPQHLLFSKEKLSSMVLCDAMYKAPLCQS